MIDVKYSKEFENNKFGPIQSENSWDFGSNSQKVVRTASNTISQRLSPAIEQNDEKIRTNGRNKNSLLNSDNNLCSGVIFFQKWVFHAEM